MDNNELPKARGERRDPSINSHSGKKQLSPKIRRQVPVGSITELMLLAELKESIMDQK
jgi:hypothetical protein